MRLLITGAWRNAKEYIPEVEAMGHTVFFMQHESERLPCLPQEIEGVICNNLFVYHPIELFPALRWVQLTSAGYDRVQMAYIRAHQIEIYNAGNTYSVPMAEFALCGVLQLYKQSRRFYEQQKRHLWEKQSDIFELAGKTVGVIGCGNVGIECAKRFSALDAKVIGVNRSLRTSPYFDRVYPIEQLDTVLPLCDIIILTIALTNETNHLINQQRFTLLKKTAVLVNLARGALVDQFVMEQHLSEKKLFGAVLDVFEEEPLDEKSMLWGMQNVIVTPHNSFVGHGNEKRLWNVIKQNLLDTRAT